MHRMADRGAKIVGKHANGAAYGAVGPIFDELGNGTMEGMRVSEPRHCHCDCEHQGKTPMTASGA